MTPLEPAPTGYPIKLVRDRTAEIINSTGEPGDLFYGPVDGERLPWLIKKLVEELAEYVAEPGRIELQDVLAVIEALAYEHDTTFEGLVSAMRADPRGGFMNGVMMYGCHPEFDR